MALWSILAAASSTTTAISSPIRRSSLTAAGGGGASSLWRRQPTTGQAISATTTTAFVGPATRTSQERRAQEVSRQSPRQAHLAKFTSGSSTTRTPSSSLSFRNNKNKNNNANCLQLLRGSGLVSPRFLSSSSSDSDKPLEGTNNSNSKNTKTKNQAKRNSSKKEEADNDKAPKNAYAATILLPDTAFSQRANAIVREPELQAYWNRTNLYHKLSHQAAQRHAPRFVLHDGPPYANGDLHCGHALNKILKDFINRYQVLFQQKQVHYVPGWDCHGLPIELKVLQNNNMPKSKTTTERQSLTPVVELRQMAAAFAAETVQSQSTSFQRYGIFGDFEHPYLTMQPAFEAAQIRVFGTMFDKGFIFRGRKPVHWSPSSQTALAEAELEYPPNHVSKSIYVAFPVEEPSAALKPFHYSSSSEQPLQVAIWTTTPWTIPANLAVAVNPRLSYSVVQHPKTGKLLVATELIETLAQKFQLGKNSDDESLSSSSSSSSFELLATMTGEDVIGTTYRHPLPSTNHRISPVVAGGEYITTESGTGLVHTAPGHGQDDYLTGLKYGLDLLSPVDDYGRFTAEAGAELEGKAVLAEGNVAVMNALAESKALLLQEDYNHKYPYDWRTKKPTIFRATDQWFASVEGFREEALQAISTVQWVPAVGINRITSFVSGRGDWCISRQRSWGVPIPVFYDRATGEKVLLNDQTLQHIQQLFAEHGSDCWWTMEERDLLPDEYKDEADKWKKGTDTMDVWFDSGSSWAGVAQAREELAYPADVYLEGSDQHRGWFQSSLLTSVANTGKAPFKTVLTHGFVLDEKGFKMSKSLGNVVDPRKVIEGGNNKKTEPAYGADVLRLWVANSDYSSDVLIGDNIIRQTFDSYRKLRNTARYLIGNLGDFTPETTTVPYEELPSLDKYMLGQLSHTLNTVNEAMGQYQFQRAVQEILRFATADLSNFYLDVAKDRLYISGIDDARRRSCQTVIHACLEGFAKAVAPLLPHLAEDIWQNLPYKKSKDKAANNNNGGDEDESVFENGVPSQLMSYAPHDEEMWSFVRALRDDVNKCIELARNDKYLGASLECAAYVHVPSDDKNEKKRSFLNQLDGDDSLISPPVKTNGVDELRTALMLSQIHMVDSPDEVTRHCRTAHTQEATKALSGVMVGVTKAKGGKCGRCWFYDEAIVALGGDGDDDDDVGLRQRRQHGVDLCQRCDEAITMWERQSGQTFVNPTIAAAEKEPATTA
ncbi:hypothetical protein ACA910_003462 [Epithemia clementina (nom. ined.)]